MVTETVCWMCGGSGIIGNGPTSFNPQLCPLCQRTVIYTAHQVMIMDFLAGCEHAHKLREDAEMAILSDVFTVIENQQTLSMDDAEYKALETVKEELKRLRK